MTAKKPCPRYELELNNTYNLAFFRTINAQNKDVYEDLTHYTGVEVHDVTSVEKIFNTLEVEVFESNNQLLFLVCTNQHSN